MDNKAIFRYKYYLCRKFLDAIFAKKLITKTQKASLENAIVKRLAEL